MDAEQYLADLAELRLRAVKGPERDAAALYSFELRGAADALVAAGLLDGSTADSIVEGWHRALEADGLQRRDAVGFGMHVRAEAVSVGGNVQARGSSEPDQVVRADPLDVHITDVGDIRLVADALILFTRGFELRVAFRGGTSTARADLLTRMSRNRWEWLIQDTDATQYRVSQGHGGLGAYTFRFRPAIPAHARELHLTVTEDSQRVALVTLQIPGRSG